MKRKTANQQRTTKAGKRAIAAVISLPVFAASNVGGKRARSFLLIVVVLFYSFPSVRAQGNKQDPGEYSLPISLQGVSKMPNGDQLRYSYHFDHTAFRD